MRPSEPRQETVLLAEDDAVVLELMVQVLRTGGFRVVAAPTGERALLALREERGRIDWLVTKVSLPGLACGWIVADEYRSWQPGRPVVFASDERAAAGPASPGAIFTRERAPFDVLDILRGLSAMAAHSGAVPAATARAA